MREIVRHQGGKFLPQPAAVIAGAFGPETSDLMMRTIAMTASTLQVPRWLRSIARWPDFITLTKPRVMSLAVFTAFVGLKIAPGHLDPLHGFVAILSIAMGAAAAGVLNMWYEADIDAVMPRTAGRPIPLGTVSGAEALAFGLVLACGAVGVLALAVDVKAAALLAFAIFFYVVVYTIWLKRQTPQNIVIGGVAGALPAVIGWAAATGAIGLEPLILFLIVFLWTPPHFWALSLNRADEYARAGGCRGCLVSPVQFTVRQRPSAEQFSLYSRCGCVGATEPIRAILPAYSHSRFSTYWRCSRRS
jgi:protoheme IX farnesyltransferase